MTIDAPCPNCGTIYTVRRELIGKRTKCTRCGTPFVITETPAVPAPATSPPPPPSSAPSLEPDAGLYADIPIHQSYAAHPIPPVAGTAVPSRSAAPTPDSLEHGKPAPTFSVIKMVAKGYEILAIIIAIFAVVMLVLGIVRIIMSPSSVLAVLLSVGMMCVWAVVSALMCLFVSQVVRLFLQIEQNTRESSQACRQLAEHFGGIQIDK
jgi:predicted Zn finger-like uncharacterized protein